MRITKAEFEALYGASMSDREKEEFMSTQVVIPCDCDYEGCKGWQVIDKNLYEFEIDNNLR
jgi:hypothetical protein